MHENYSTAKGDGMILNEVELLDAVATAINQLPISTGYKCLVFVEIGETIQTKDPSFNLDAWLNMRRK